MVNSRNRRPHWLKVRLAGGKTYREVNELIQNLELHTVCRSARCPNVGDCWSRRTATFMILGDVCTRNCRFCAVKTGHPGMVDSKEPEKVAQAVKALNLRHVVITSVTRDDLPDGGAAVFVDTIRRIRAVHPGCSIEVLIPDFQGKQTALQAVFNERPDILNHNLEVVPRLYPLARAQALFDRSLQILRLAKQEGLISKTGIMVGLGESWEEITGLLKLLADIQLDVLTIGQYLQPSRRHLPVVKYYQPEEFEKLKELGEAFGIAHVESGPLVRSSYHADEQIERLAVSES